MHVYSGVIRGREHIDILLARHPHVTKKNNYLPGGFTVHYSL